jgi:predicted dehydrogenase
MWDAENVYLEWRMQEKTSGSGSLADFGVHMLDLTDYLLHDLCGDFTDFTAMVSTEIKERYLIDPKDPMGGKAGDEKGNVTNDDVAAFTAISESGTLFSFNTGRLVSGVSLFEIAGENGVLLRCSTYPNTQIGCYIRGEGEGFPMLKPIEIDEEFRGGDSMRMGHLGVAKEFVDCIKTGKKPVRDFTRGLYIQRLVDNFVKAAKTGQTVHEKVAEKDI